MWFGWFLCMLFKKKIQIANFKRYFNIATKYKDEREEKEGRGWKGDSKLSGFECTMAQEA